MGKEIISACVLKQVQQVNRFFFSQMIAVWVPTRVVLAGVLDAPTAAIAITFHSWWQPNRQRMDGWIRFPLHSLPRRSISATQSGMLTGE